MRPTGRQQYGLVWVIVFMGLTFLVYRIGFKTSSDTPRSTYISNGDIIGVPIERIMSGEPIPLEQDDPHIINYILSHGHLEPPSREPYDLKDSINDPSRGQGQLIQELLKNQRDGFFIECGALDGETRSNTLAIEKNLGWKGLLVEGDPSNYEKLKKKHRKAWISNTCLAIKPYPHQANFIPNFNTGRIAEDEPETDAEQTQETVKVQCMPLFSLLSALNVTTVDYFSLDVEGNELQVLKTIPFEKIFIKTLSVEYIHTGEGKEQILEFMESKGYKLHSEVHYERNWANDVILVHESLNL